MNWYVGGVAHAKPTPGHHPPPGSDFVPGYPDGVADRARYRAGAASARQLNILIVEGEGAINNVRQRTAREPIIQVEDENRRPVAGAAILFMLPDSGPSGVFEGGGRTLATKTDSAGRAVAKGLRVNQVQGKFQIQVEATYEGVTATATIAQVNAVLTAGAAGGGISGKMIAILAAVGAQASPQSPAFSRWRCSPRWHRRGSESMVQCWASRWIERPESGRSWGCLGRQPWGRR